MGAKSVVYNMFLSGNRAAVPVVLMGCLRHPIYTVEGLLAAVTKVTPVAVGNHFKSRLRRRRVTGLGPFSALHSRENAVALLGAPGS